MRLFLQHLAIVVLPFYCVYTYSSDCEKLKPCRCYDENDLHIKIDCSGKNVSISQVCGACKIIRNVSVMDISGTSLSEIPPFCFQDCDTLLELVMTDNDISRFDDNTFVGLLKLECLNLNGNRLVKIGNLSNPNFLAPLRKLQRLHLKMNTHETDTIVIRFYLPNVASHLLSGVQSLYLDGLPYASFDTNFRHLKNHKLMDFSGTESSCQIASLNNRSFENVPFLTHLDLSNCNIAAIEAGTFEGLRELKYLNLSYNMRLGFPALRNVSYGLQFTKLEVLDYSKVYKTFGITTQLNRCDVWYLRNTTIKELHMNSNRLAIIEINALALLPPFLEMASAKDNRLTVGHYGWQLGCLRNLKTLDVSDQYLSRSFFYYNKQLYIEENTVNTSGACNILELHMSCMLSPNKSYTPLQITTPENLETFICRSANLKFDPTHYYFKVKNLTNLRALDFSKNAFSEWYGVFVHSDKLENLSLSENFCTYISSTFFSNFRNIKVLNVSNNKLGPLLANNGNGSIFKLLTKLVDLDLSNNWIDDLPTNVLGFLNNLETIRLSSNRIKTISFYFEHMKNLSRLYLTQNEISTLPLTLLNQVDQYSKFHSKTVVIDLSRNELSLSCVYLEFLRWLKEHPTTFVDIQSYTFRENNGSLITYGTFVAGFTDFQKSCQSYTTVLIISTICISIFISLTVGGLVYRYRWRLRYLYYMAKARYKRYHPVKGDEIEKMFQYDAFISYATENYEFVTGDMFQQLEEAGLTLCLHQKDFVPGTYIAENILQAIKNSKRIVIVLSYAFLESRWGMYELNMARMESIYCRNGENIIIVVKYEDFDMTRASPELRDCLESESYLDYTQVENEMPYFWQMLVQAIRS